MFNFGHDFRRVATAAIGAIILSTACVGAAIGPVQAATPAATASVA